MSAKWAKGSWLDRCEVDQQTFAYDIGINEKTAREWRDHKYKPNEGNFEKLAEYFDCSLNELTEDFMKSKCWAERPLVEALEELETRGVNGVLVSLRREFRCQGSVDKLATAIRSELLCDKDGNTLRALRASIVNNLEGCDVGQLYAVRRLRDALFMVTLLPTQNKPDPHLLKAYSGEGWVARAGVDACLPEVKQLTHMRFHDGKLQADPLFTRSLSPCKTTNTDARVLQIAQSFNDASKPDYRIKYDPQNEDDFFERMNEHFSQSNDTHNHKLVYGKVAAAGLLMDALAEKKLSNLRVVDADRGRNKKDCDVKLPCSEVKFEEFFRGTDEEFNKRLTDEENKMGNNINITKANQVNIAGRDQKNDNRRAVLDSSEHRTQLDTRLESLTDAINEAREETDSTEITDALQQLQLDAESLKNELADSNTVSESVVQRFKRRLDGAKAVLEATAGVGKGAKAVIGVGMSTWEMLRSAF